MLAKVKSYTYSGIEGIPIDVEVDLINGLPSVDTVGLPGTAVKESKERVHSAIKNSGYHNVVKKVLINLAPADVKKEGPLFDLPIAIAMLLASEEIVSKVSIEKIVFIGELSLDGSLRPVKGVLPILISAMQSGFTKFVIPFDNRHEASFVSNVEVYAMRGLAEVASFVKGEPHSPEAIGRRYEDILRNTKFSYDIGDIRGQTVAKRALEIAVAGGHNILMQGPPGTGKTMLAKAIPSIMPSMSFDEAVEVTKIHSIAGILDISKGIVTERPFRSPHHTTTAVALIGGGNSAKPGEISLAHNGVLFLDELPEYSKHTIEALRQPLEDGSVTVARLAHTYDYPADFMLVASMNPCPCGNLGSYVNTCKCSSAQLHNYVSKLSAPLLDRIDIKVDVDNIPYEELRGENREEKSEVVRARIEAAREIQRTRFEGSGVFTNSRMNNEMIKKYCALNAEGEKLVERAYKRMSMSARSLNRIMKVARTIADLDGAERISLDHLSEAIAIRQNVK